MLIGQLSRPQSIENPTAEQLQKLAGLSELSPEVIASRTPRFDRAEHQNVLDGLALLFQGAEAARDRMAMAILTDAFKLIQHHLPAE